MAGSAAERAVQLVMPGVFSRFTTIHTNRQIYVLLRHIMRDSTDFINLNLEENILH